MIRRVLPAAAAALVLAAGCSGARAPDTPAASLQDEPTAEAAAVPTPTSAPPPTATTAPPVLVAPPVTVAPLTPEEDEVVRAYLRSWEVMAEAYRTLDPSVLDQAFDDEALALKIEGVEEQRRRNELQLLSFEHQIQSVRWYPPDGAVVRADIEDHTVVLDAASGELRGSEGPAAFTRDLGLRRTGGEGWQVIFIAGPE